MKVACWTIGKTKEPYLREGIRQYEKRLKRYLSFGWTEIPDVRQAGKMPADKLMAEEAGLIRQRIQPNDRLILLDENGKQLTSPGFAGFLDNELQHTAGKLIFVVGGAYGFTDELKKEAHHLLSLSKMTFSHQMVRLFFIEQMYRAMTILRNEPYHHA